MPDSYQKVANLPTELDETPAVGDLIHIVDVSDTSYTGGTSKKITWANLVKNYVDGLISTLTSSLSSHISDTTTHGTTGDIVGTTDSQTLTNKTLENPISTGTDTVPKQQGAASAAQFTQFVGEFDNGNSGATKTIDWSKGDRQLVTMSASCTFSFSNPVKGQTLTLRVVENGTGGYTITLPTLKWPAGTVGSPTTTANAINLYIFYYDGTNYLAQLAAGFA